MSLLFIGGLLLRSLLAQTPVQRGNTVQQAAPGQRRVPQTSPDLSAVQQAPLTPVLTESLGKTHQLIGPLRLPLGEMTTVTMRVEPQEEKGHFDHYVTVTAIAGRRVERPIRMPAKLWQWGDIKSIEEGDQVTARVYQDGGMVGVPDKAMKETVPIQSQRHAFVTWLVIVKSAR